MTADDIERLNYYEKQFLRTQDFRDEQAYHIEMRRRHNIAHHTWGIVIGLEITQDQTSKIWSVQPGLAVDGFGREIIVLNPEPLNTEQIAGQLAGTALSANLKVWIEYDIEKTNRQLPGYEVCNGNNQFTRTRETFRLIHQDNPPTRDQSKPPWPFEDLPDDPDYPKREAHWPIYLGTITWNKDPSDPTKKIKESVDFKERRYVGNITSEVLAPAGELSIRDRNAPHPLESNDRGVVTKLEGSLEVDRLLNANQDVHVQGRLGIGTEAPKHRLEIHGPDNSIVVLSTATSGFDRNAGIELRTQAADGVTYIDFTKGSTSTDGSGTPDYSGRISYNEANTGDFAIKGGKIGIGTQTPRNVLGIRATGSSHELISFEDPNGYTKWHINQNFQNNPGLNFAETGVADGRLFIKAGGNLGVGTTSPTAKLNVFNDQANPNYANQAVIGAFRGGFTESDGVNRNRLVLENSSSSGETSLDLRLNDPSGNTSGTHLYQRANHFGIWRSVVGTVLAIDNSGNVGITKNLTAKSLFDGTAFKIAAGKTDLNKWKDWKVGIERKGIYMEVDTTTAGFTQTPLYIASLHGEKPAGTGIILSDAKENSFKVYIGGSNLRAATANSNGWHIQWIGIQL